MIIYILILMYHIFIFTKSAYNIIIYYSIYNIIFFVIHYLVALYCHEEMQYMIKLFFTEFTETSIHVQMLILLYSSKECEILRLNL